VTTTAERLEAARVKIDRAREAVESEEGASPVLVAVVNEFAKKADKAARSKTPRARTPARSTYTGATSSPSLEASGTPIRSRNTPTTLRPFAKSSTWRKSDPRPQETESRRRATEPCVVGEV
jgi:hypothetical protein